MASENDENAPSSGSSSTRTSLSGREGVKPRRRSSFGSGVSEPRRRSSLSGGGGGILVDTIVLSPNVVAGGQQQGDDCGGENNAMQLCGGKNIVAAATAAPAVDKNRKKSIAPNSPRCKPMIARPGTAPTRKLKFYDEDEVEVDEGSAIKTSANLPNTISYSSHSLLRFRSFLQQTTRRRKAAATIRRRRPTRKAVSPRRARLQALPPRQVGKKYS